MSDGLDSLRRQIRELDEDLMKLVARRMDLSRQVGELKLRLNLPVKDYRVEKEVIGNARRRARELGFYEDLAEDLQSALIRYSCWLQEEFQTRSKVAPPGSQRKILVIGGLGPMGRWLSEFFEAFGHQVTVLDPVANATARFPVVTDLAEALRTAEVVALATPISVTGGILESITRLRTKALVFDICSLKTPIIDAIHQAIRAGLRVTSVHPMFGPGVEMLSGRNILLCDSGHPVATEDAEKLFGDSTAKLVRLPLEDHDKYVACILGASHLANLIFNESLLKSQIPFAELAAIGSTTFTAQAGLGKTVASENQDLYYEIQTENRYTAELLAHFEAALKSFKGVITGRDRIGFKRLMQRGHDYFEKRG